MKDITVLGIDLAKSVFQLHGVDSKGKPVLRQSVRRGKLVEQIAQIPPCQIAMEACGGAHFWARKFEACGHSVKLVAPQFVRPFVKSNKTDRADAEAIVEAASRPSMRFVPVKSLWQQEIQTIHRVRELLIRQRTGLINAIHGLAMEYGVFLPATASKMRREIELALSSDDEVIPPFARRAIRGLVTQFDSIQDELQRVSSEIENFASTNQTCRRLLTIPGVGPLTASACMAAIGDPKQFRNGRHFSAFLGLVPRQHSTGGKQVLLGISKRGDPYIRKLLVHGSRAVVTYAIKKQKTDRISQWATQKEKTRGMNRATVALANKNARMIWALMNSGEQYRAA